MAKSFPNTGATVIDTSADLPAASGALEGVMMFQKDTNELKICDGASWVSVIDTDTPPGLTLLNSTSFTSQTGPIAINNVFNASYDSYYMDLKMNAVTGGVGGFRMRSGTTDNANTNYRWTGTYMSSGSSTISSASDNAASFLRVGYFEPGMTVHCSVWVNFPFLNVYTNYNTVNTNYNTVALVASQDIWGGGMNVTTSYDGFSIVNSNGGTMTGSIKTYGYRNS